MRHIVRVVCFVCSGRCEVVDEEMSTGVRVCGECNGHGWKFENAHGAACDVLTHEEIEPVDALP